jgi:ligand-binding SRPBCC domain-containing protein
MKIYRLHTKQNLPITIDEAWDLLSDPKNLQKITPEYMGFKILSGADRPAKWVTEITHVVDKKYFVDEQRFGPYALWHHKHFIKEIDGGVEMEDIVDYKVPLGILGQLVHPFLVKPKLNEIFEYRRKKLIEMFGEFKPQ